MKKYFKLLITILLFNINIVYAEEFDITSKNAILYNMNDNKVLYELNSNEKVEVASLTKIMTTIVALENNTNLDEEVVITKEMLEGISEYSQVGFKVGDKPTVKDLLYGAMLPSGADAVNALAIHTSGSIDKFVSLMNKKAKTLNLKNTHFDNPIGMDSEDNYSTASDIAKLLIYSLKNDTFKTIFTSKEYKIEYLNKTIKTTLNSYSKAYGLDISNITGAKSGFTDEAGLCLASTSTIDNVNYLLITLGANTTNRSNAVKDTLKIYDYYSSSYSYKTVLEKDYTIKTIKVKWGREKEYNITSNEDISLYIANTVRKNRIKYIYNGVEEINYKIKKGDKLGTVKLVYDNETLTTIDVYLNKDIEYYHPLIYGLIILSIIIMFISLKHIIASHRYKRNRR